MSEEKQELNRESAAKLALLFKEDKVAGKAIEEISSHFPLPIRDIVLKLYAADDKDKLDTANLHRMIRGTRGFFPETIYDFLHAVAYGESEQVVSMFRKYPELFLKKVPEFKAPCGDILFDVCPLDLMLFYLNGPISEAIQQVLTECPKDYIAAVVAQCRKMQGGGADLVKMTKDPRTADFTRLVIDKDLIYPLLQNNDGLVFYNNKLFYVTQAQFIMEIDERSIPPEYQNEYTVFKANVNEMEAYTSRRSSNSEHKFIQRVLGITLERGGIRYQREGIHYQDTQVGMELGIAYRRYLRLYKKQEISSDSIDRAWLTIGWKQRQSILMLQWLCDERPSYPLPDENTFREGPSQRTLKFINWSKCGVKCSVLPFGSAEGLGFDLTLHKGEKNGAESPLSGWSRKDSGQTRAELDFLAYCRIVTVGTACIAEFADQLYTLTLSRCDTSPG